MRLCLRLRWLRLCLRWGWSLVERDNVSFIGRFTNKKNRNEIQVIKPGVYHFVKSDDQQKTRVHLRIEPDGNGLLLVNAARSFQLNPSAAFMAFLALHETNPHEAIHSIKSKFNVSTKKASLDYQSFSLQLKELIEPDGLCPICDLDLETSAPFSTRPFAPYRMDLAITYRCNNACAHCYNARSRNYPELTTSEWKQVIDRLWEIGIPHVVFTGGEPTLRDDLPELIAYAENKGQITGINTNGRRLKDSKYVSELVSAGLDHVQITLESHLPDIHDQMVRHPGAWEETVAGIKNVVATRLYVMTNTTMLKNNAPYLAGTLDFLAELELPTVGLNALIYSGHGKEVDTGLNEKDLEPLLFMAREKTDAHQQKLIWYTPTQYCHFDPMQLNLGIKGCTAALFNMCIEPDGSVIPCQSYYSSLGKILEKDWPEIWNHDLAVHLRERRNLPQECQLCSFVSECGGGCPLALSKFEPHRIAYPIHV